VSKRPQLILCSADSAYESAQLAQEALAEAAADDRSIYLLRLGAGSTELWRFPWWGLLRLAAEELGGWIGGPIGEQPPDPRLVPWLPGLDEILAALLATHLSQSDPDALVVVDCGPDLLRWMQWLADAERVLEQALFAAQSLGPMPAGLDFDPTNPSPAQLMAQLLGQARRAVAQAQVRQQGDSHQRFLVALLSAREHAGTVTSSPDAITWRLPVPCVIGEDAVLDVGTVLEGDAGPPRVIVCVGERCVTLQLPAALRRARLVEATLVEGTPVEGSTVEPDADEVSAAPSALLLHFTADPKAW
jgi:hypothetical protein